MVFLSIDRKIAGGVTVTELKGSYYYGVIYFEYSSINKSDMIDDNDDAIFKSIREKVRTYEHKISNDL